jgi:hypothetical protein
MALHSENWGQRPGIMPCYYGIIIGLMNKACQYSRAPSFLHGEKSPAIQWCTLYCLALQRVFCKIQCLVLWLSSVHEEWVATSVVKVSRSQCWNQWFWLKVSRSGSRIQIRLYNCLRNLILELAWRWKLGSKLIEDLLEQFDLRSPWSLGV